MSRFGRWTPFPRRQDNMDDKPWDHDWIDPPERKGEPALTREQWKQILEHWDLAAEEAHAEPGRIVLHTRDGTKTGVDAVGHHGRIAIALYRHAYGFARGDVDILRSAALNLRQWPGHAFAFPQLPDALEDLADRIEALLPPRDLEN